MFTFAIILGILALLFFIVRAYIAFHPAFGAGPAKSWQLEQYRDLPNHTGKKFTNLYSVKEDLKPSDFREIIKEMLKKNPNRRPQEPLPQKEWTKAELLALPADQTTAIWLGHSAILLKINSKFILFDPMLGNRPSPVPFGVGSRFNKSLAIPFDEFPELDLIVLTHDHYDHLDHGTIKKLKDRTKAFLMPLGVGAHLRKWGVPPEKITELYWHEETTFYGISFTATPSQHFTGRGPSDKMHTLWCSWVIKTGEQQLFFNGDSGYFKGFKAIGEQYGPFDYCFMECGQYNRLWHDIHMFPEETAQAFLDIKGKTLIPIHWGAFSLSTHSWDDPIQRLEKASNALKIDLQVPALGSKLTLIKKAINV